MADGSHARRNQIDTALRDQLVLRMTAVPPRLADAMSYSLLAPGKRLRPLLCGRACEAAGGSFEQSLAAGVALEMVHTYSLIHDDLPAMDDDDLRRGLPTCHVKFGDALAILAGDALLTLAFEIVASYPAVTAARMTLELARGAGAAGMVAGQVLDLQAEGRVGTPPPATLDHLESIHRRKTGALFTAAVTLGLFAAQGERDGGPDPAILSAGCRFAAAFGLLFQITDDLLDVQSTSTTAGKRVGKDAGRGKLTYPGLLGIDASRARAAELGQDAQAAAAEFGPAGQSLADLAVAAVARDR